MKTSMQFIAAQHAVRQDNNSPAAQIQLSCERGNVVLFVDTDVLQRLQLGEHYEVELHLPETH